MIEPAWGISSRECEYIRREIRAGKLQSVPSGRRNAANPADSDGEGPGAPMRPNTEESRR
jgi:hypothetical protein